MVTEYTDCAELMRLITEQKKATANAILAP